MVDFKAVAARMKAKSTREQLKLVAGEVDCIIAGSRGLGACMDLDLVTLAAKRSGFNICRVISGTAAGVDRAGEAWAARHGIEVERHPANWGVDGKSAGYKRNQRMANVADALIAIWDTKSKGTKHMIDIARDAELKVFVLEVIRFGVSTKGGAHQFIVACDPNGILLWVPENHRSRLLGRNIEELIQWGNCDVEEL